MRIICQVCGQKGYLQQLGNYFRVRHYSSGARVSGKYSFIYHRQTRECVASQINCVD